MIPVTLYRKSAYTHIHSRKLNLLEQLHASNTPPSNLLVGVLSNIGGYHGRDQTHSEPTNDSSDVQLRQTGRMQSSTSLHNASDNEDDIRDNESLLSAKGIRYVERRHGPEKAT